MNNPTLGEFCFAMIGRADIEGSKSDVAMNAWPPQASYPCGNFSDTSCSKLLKPKGSIGRAFAVRIRTENQDQASFCPFALREVSVLTELGLGHLRYHLTDVPPQSTPRLAVSSDRVVSGTNPQNLRPKRRAPLSRRLETWLNKFGSSFRRRLAPLLASPSK